MNEITDYTMITTIAVVLLAIGQLVFLLVVILLGMRFLRIMKQVRQTTQMSKEFVSTLRDQQMQNASMFKVGLVAFRQLHVLINKRRKR